MNARGNRPQREPERRFAIYHACPDGVRGPVEGTKVFLSKAAAERAATLLHATKLFENYAVVEIGQ